MRVYSACDPLSYPYPRSHLYTDPPTYPPTYLPAYLPTAYLLFHHHVGKPQGDRLRLTRANHHLSLRHHPRQQSNLAFHQL